MVGENHFRRVEALYVKCLKQEKPERKRKNLIRLGIKHGEAYAWSRTRMGGWAVAQLERSGNRQHLKK